MAVRAPHLYRSLRCFCLAGFSLLVLMGFALVKLEPHGSDLESFHARLAEERSDPAEVSA